MYAAQEIWSKKWMDGVPAALKISAMIIHPDFKHYNCYSSINIIIGPNSFIIVIYLA